MMEVEVVPTGALLEVDAYTVVEVSDDAVVWACASNPKNQYYYCDPKMGLMGHEDLMVTLGHNINNEVVDMANSRAIEILLNNYFAL